MPRSLRGERGKQCSRREMTCMFTDPGIRRKHFEECSGSFCFHCVMFYYYCYLSRSIYTVFFT
jgi:hypothetical protein